VPRISSWALCLVALSLVSVMASRSEAGSAGESLLPATTKGFVSITNLPELSAQWEKTQIGQLMDDPTMKPFSEDLRRQLQNRWSGLREQLGLTLDDLEGVPSGELSVSVVEVAPKQPGTVFLVDVTNHQQQAQQLIAKVSARLTGQGARQSTLTVAGVPVLVFDLPKQERHTYYFLSGNLLGAANDPEIVRSVLARQAGRAAETLADVPAFQHAMARAQKDAGEHVPQIRWFIEPLGYFELTRQERPEGPRRRARSGRSFLEVAKEQGFAGIRGMGGFVDVAGDPAQILHRTAVIAPSPFEKSLKMLRFINTTDFTPPGWVPREIATFTMFHADVMNAFDNFGGLFDALFGEGEEDVWKESLESLKIDPDGPRLDLRNELFANLGNRVLAIGDYQRPINPNSERLLFAIETKDEKKVATAIRKAMEKDKGIRRREFDGHIVWEAVPPEKQPTQAPKIELGRVPRLGSEEEEEEEAEQETRRLLPSQAVTVANGYLIIASHYDFLVKILQRIDPRESLARDIDFRVVQATMAQLGADGNFLRSFTRTDEELRPTYELIRQGRMPQSETMLGRVLNTLLGKSNEPGPRKQEIDGSKMPDYDFVRRSLGPGGMFGTAEENGWFFKGFVLPKP